MAISLKPNLTMNDFINYIESSFDILKEAAPVAFWYENLNPNGEILDIHFSTRMREMLGFKSIEEFPDEYNSLVKHVHPDDVEIMKSTADDAKAEKTSKFDVDYRIRTASKEYIWCNATGELVKDSNGVIVGMYGAFIDLTSKRTKENLMGLLTTLVSSFDCLYIINPERDTFAIHKKSNNKAINKLVKDSHNRFTETIKKCYLADDIYPADKEELLKYCSIDYLLSALKNNLTNTFRFRKFIDGHWKWYEQKLFRIDDLNGDIRRIVLGFSICDDAVSTSFAFESLLNQYDAIYTVDLDNDEIKPIRSSRVTSEGNFKGILKYTDVAKKFIQSVDERYRKDCENFAKIDFMRDYLAKDDYREYVYTIPNLEKPVRRFAASVLERVDGVPKTLLISFTGIDDQRAKMIQLNRSMAYQKGLLEYFMEPYYSAYLIDLVNDSFELLHKAKDISLLPKNHGYWSSIQEFIKQNFYQVDQKNLLDFLNPKNISNTLKSDHSASVVARLVLNKKTYFVKCLVIRGIDEYHIGLGFMDITDQIKQEKEVEENLQKALKDANELNKTRIVIEALTEDFGCVSYVAFTKNSHEDIAFMYRTSKLLSQIIPEWSKERYFHKRIQLLADKFVFEDDKKAMIHNTKREFIIKNLNKSDTFFVHFRAKINGQIKYYEMKFSAVRTNDKLTGFVMGLHSIDNLVKKELEAQYKLEKALQGAEVANKAKTSFLFNMSHDIRTPLNAVKGFSTMARKYKNEPAKVEDYLRKIDIAEEQLIKLINQVLEMSRIESGSAKIFDESINILKKIDSIVTVFSASAASKGISFETEISNIIHENIIVDDTRLGQILYNLLGNSIKYTLEGGSIKLKINEVESPKAGCARFIFEISDTGIGMSKEFVKNAFKPFEREATSTVSKIEGTGLGLTIVKKIVDLFGGTIEVESELGVGSKFVVTLDIKIDYNPTKQVEETSSNVQEVLFKGYKVLLVEDNEMNREIASDILSELGFVVEEAEDGDIAVDKIKEIYQSSDYYYDAILMDIQMPRMNGYKATREIRKILSAKNINLPIIAMTANAFEEDKQNAIDAGMNAHLAKPVEIPKLLEIFQKIVYKGEK